MYCYNASCTCLIANIKHKQFCKVLLPKHRLIKCSCSLTTCAEGERIYKNTMQLVTVKMLVLKPKGLAGVQKACLLRFVRRFQRAPMVSLKEP